MILIAESGSTKTDWVLIDENGIIDRQQSSGINPFFQNSTSIYENIKSIKTWDQVNQIFFYGAGCANSEKNQIVEDALKMAYPDADCEINSDLLAAARSLCGSKKGIACILGTGSNSCLYNGKQIEHNVSPLGFILGDEGSGAVLGGKLIADILKNKAPKELSNAFFNKYETNSAEIIHKVYKDEFPNRFLAGLTVFLHENIKTQYVQELVRNSFIDFFKRNIQQYNNYSKLPVHFTGSIAFYFKKELEAAAIEFGINMGKTIQSPLEDLIIFHLELEKKAKELIKKKPSVIITEASSNFSDLEKMTVLELLNGINQEDELVHLAVNRTIPEINRFVSLLIDRIKAGGRLFYLGAGTSGRLGVLDASELPPTFGVSGDIVIGLIAGGDRALRNAVESAEDDPDKAWAEIKEFGLNENDSVLGIAASGTTPYVIGGVKKAREKGLLTACITCNPDSPVSKEAEIAIEAIVGPEFVTGSTRLKAGTAQKMILNMITTSLMIKLERVKGNKMVNMQLTNNKLVERGTQMIMDELDLEKEISKNLLLKHGSVKKAIEAYK